MSKLSTTNGQRILVPLDFSEASRLALKAALKLAQQPKDVLHLFYMPGMYAKTPEDTALTNRPFRDGVEKAKQHFLAWAAAERNDVEVKMLVQTERPDITSVADTAIRLGSTLIVLSRRKNTFWERCFGGGPTEQLNRIAPCSVYLVK